MLFLFSLQLYAIFTAYIIIFTSLNVIRLWFL